MKNKSIVSEEKIKIARELNEAYHVFYIERELHQKKWKEILSKCEAEGISPDLIQISPDIFKFLVDKKAVAQYFKTEGENNG